MKPLFVIGNGMDIALGLKTSYEDFYHYYLKQPSQDKDIVSLKQNMEAERYSTWADLELGLGQYTAQCASDEIFLKCIEDVRSSLGKYLNEQEKGLMDMSGFDDLILKPWSFIEPVSLPEFQAFAVDKSEDKAINIVTLNYTSTIEQLLAHSRIFRPVNVVHLHGTINSMVIGVNDADQIANKDFATNIEFMEEFVKPIYNDACMNNKNNVFSDIIADSNMFILYGTSIGESDRKWWHAIGNRLVSDNDPAVLFYFPFDKKKDVVKHPNYLLRWTKQYFTELMAKLGISGEKLTDSIRKRVFIGINKSLFKPIIVAAPHPSKAI